MEPSIKAGDEAPDFTLPDQNKEQWSLSSFRGRKAVLLVFYPAAFTGICTGELCALRDDPATFSTDSVETATISVDSSFAHKVFAEREGFEFPLLSDFWPHGAVAQLYGSFNAQAGIANRGTYLVDLDGVVRFSQLNGPGEGRDPQDWRDAISALAVG